MALPRGVDPARLTQPSDRASAAPCDPQLLSPTPPFFRRCRRPVVRPLAGPVEALRAFSADV